MKKILAISLIALAATAANAEAAWVQYSIWSPGDLLLPWNRPEVRGLRLDMPYGSTRGSVVGLDLGLAGVTGSDAVGLAVTAVNIADAGSAEGVQFGLVANHVKEFRGVQFGGILNWNEEFTAGLQLGTINFGGEFYGFQLGAVNWFTSDASGVSLGAFFLTDDSFSGFSAGALNYAIKNVDGVQFGGINLAAENSTGLQLGLVNISRHHEGVQLGLVNINGLGFLPCLPFVNFNFTR